MGGLCSKPSPRTNPYAGSSGGKEKQYSHRRKVQRDASKVAMTPSKVQHNTEKDRQTEVKESPKLSARYGNVIDDEFYDGIPRYRRSLSLKSRSLRVSEVSSRLGRAGSVGLEKAVEALDTLGSSMTSFNSTSGFVPGAKTKNNELSILAFEVANTIVKGSNLMQSLSKRSIRQLKEVVLTAEGVQHLVSKDVDELLKIVAADKREELKVFSEEVVRFGNRCKDPQWHHLNRFFEKRSRDRTPQKLSREVAESVMQQLMTLVQLTAELYQELHALDRFAQDYQRKRLEELRHNTTQKGDRDNSLNIVAAELKSQKKLVKNLNKKSLWSRSMEEIMGQLVDIVLFLNQDISYIFGISVGETPEKGSPSSRQKLGTAGLALHYANIILQIDSIVARSSSMPPYSRDTLYQSLPPDLKASLRSKVQSFKIEKELTVAEIKDEMEKTLHWLVPTATNTAKAHHGFGWVGEWANTGSEKNHRTVSPSDVMKIETLHHADKQKTEAYILDLLLWLNYLVSRAKSSAKGSIAKPFIRSPVCSPHKEADKQPVDATNAKSPRSSSQALSDKTQALALSNGRDFGFEQSVAETFSERRGNDELAKNENGLENGTTLDAIDRVGTHG